MVGLVEYGTNLILDWISNYGYLGILFLMTLESATLPVPSEIVMPFAGFLVADKSTSMTLPGVIIAGSIGCVIGSIAAYAVGYYAGRPLILRYGRYVLLTQKHLDSAERWFAKYGDKATFLARLLPVIRTVISLPAGISKMKFKRFVLYSFVGSVPWTAALAYIGFVLGEHWKDLEGIFHRLDVVVVVAALAVIAYYLYRIRRGKPAKVEPHA